VFTSSIHLLIRCIDLIITQQCIDKTHSMFAILDLEVLKRLATNITDFCSDIDVKEKR
jgi:hypothetical protein